MHGVRLRTTGRPSAPYSRTFVESSRLASSGGRATRADVAGRQEAAIASRDEPPCQITPRPEGDLHPGCVARIVAIVWILSPMACSSAATPRSASRAGRRVIASVFQRGANFPA